MEGHSYNRRMQGAREGESVLGGLVRRAIDAAGGWLPFDRFMAFALYAPGLGYYARGATLLGASPADGSDFTTAPEMSALFGATLAHQVRQALDATGTDELWEFGAGSGALAMQMLQALGDRVRRFTIVDVSGALRVRQRERLAPFGDRVQWIDALPEATVKYMTDKIPMRRCGELAEVAAMIAWIVSPACSFTTGFTFDLSGGRATY